MLEYRCCIDPTPISSFLWFGFVFALARLFTTFLQGLPPHSCAILNLRGQINSSHAPWTSSCSAIRHGRRRLTGRSWRAPQTRRSPQPSPRRRHRNAGRCKTQIWRIPCGRVSRPTGLSPNFNLRVRQVGCALFFKRSNICTSSFSFGCVANPKFLVIKK